MKIADRDYIVEPAPGAKPATVVLKVKTWGMVVAQEFVTPQQARAFASELLAAADAAEGGAL